MKVDILVNNAGYSIRGALKEINVKSAQSMFDVNVFGIINIIQAVEALSDALRLELHSHNIQVTVVEPEPVKTNFFKTLVNNSSDLVSNPNSCYSRFYESDARNRKKQTLADPKEAAKAIRHFHTGSSSFLILSYV